MKTKNTPALKKRFEKLLLLITLAALPALAPAFAQSPPMLRGSATQYSEAIPPLDPLLWPGNKLDKDAAQALLRDPSQATAVWAQIPEWQAGEWQCNQAVNTRAIRYMNGMAVECQPIGVHTSQGEFTKGILKDKLGNIWHLFQSGYWTDTMLDDFKIVSYVIYSSPGGGEYPDLYAESVDFKVIKTTEQIATVRRAKSWTRYINLSPGTIKEETVRTNYDEQGHPTATSFNTALAKRIAAFSTYAPGFASKPAIVSSLNAFLKSRGLESHMLPTPAAGNPTQAPLAGKKPLPKH